MIKLRFASCVVLHVSLLVGCSASSSPAIGPSVAPTSSAPSTTPVAGTPTPGAGIRTLGAGEDVLAAGTYRLDLSGRTTARFPAIRFSVGDGWQNYDGWILHRGQLRAAPVGVQFWDVDEVFGQPCHWKGTLFRPGPTVGDLANALASRPLRKATPPTAVTLDGYSGEYLEWSVPTDMDFSAWGLPDPREGCDSDAGGTAFQSWTGNDGGNRYQQGPGQVDRIWILEIEGARLVIDGFSMPSATSREREALFDAVATIRFER